MGPQDDSAPGDSWMTYQAIVEMVGGPQAALSPTERALALLPRLPTGCLNQAAEIALFQDIGDFYAVATSVIDYVVGVEGYCHDEATDTVALGAACERLQNACVLELGKRRGLVAEDTVTWNFDSEVVAFEFRHPLPQRVCRYAGEHVINAGIYQPARMDPLIFLAHLCFRLDAEDPVYLVTSWMAEYVPPADCDLLIREIQGELTPEEQADLVEDIEFERERIRTDCQP